MPQQAGLPLLTCRRTALCSVVMALRKSPPDTLTSVCRDSGGSCTPSSAETAATHQRECALDLKSCIALVRVAPYYSASILAFHAILGKLRTRDIVGHMCCSLFPCSLGAPGLCGWQALQPSCPHAGSVPSCRLLALADVLQPVVHDAPMQGLEAELGAPRGQRLDDAGHIVADEDEAGDLGVCLHCSP